LSHATYQSCNNQKAALELPRTYDLLTRLRYEIEPLRAQLLAHHPCVSLMDAPAKARNEENLLQEAARGESVGLHCGWDGHVEAFYYSKKKA
jgi:hypothetical protein